MVFDKGVLNLNGIMTESGDTHQTVSIPGGLKETPGKEGIEPSNDKYNEELKKVAQSFREAADTINQLISEKQPTPPSTDELMLQQESAINDAIIDVMENGPMYEAVDRSDKAAVKEITKKIRNKVGSILNEEGYDFRKCSVAVRNIISFLKAGPIGPLVAFWNERMWQIVGICNVESGNISTITKRINEELKDDLGDYKVLAAKMPPNIVDLFMTAFGWKNTRKTYHLLIDKTLPAEAKAVEKIKLTDKDVEELRSQLATKKIKPIKEDVDMDQLYKDYLIAFAENGEDGSPLSMNEFEEAVEKFNENPNAFAENGDHAGEESDGEFQESGSTTKMNAELFGNLFKKKTNGGNQQPIQPEWIKKLVSSITPVLTTEISTLFGDSKYSDIAELKDRMIESVKGNEFKETTLGAYTKNGNTYEINVSDPPSWFCALGSKYQDMLKGLINDAAKNINDSGKLSGVTLNVFSDQYNLIVRAKANEPSKGEAEQKDKPIKESTQFLGKFLANWEEHEEE